MVAALAVVAVLVGADLTLGTGVPNSPRWTCWSPIAAMGTTSAASLAPLPMRCRCTRQALGIEWASPSSRAVSDEVSGLPPLGQATLSRHPWTGRSCQVRTSASAPSRR